MTRRRLRDSNQACFEGSQVDVVLRQRFSLVDSLSYSRKLGKVKCNSTFRNLVNVLVPGHELRRDGNAGCSLDLITR